MASQLEAQIGIAAESTFGTRVTPTRFYPFKSESLGLEKDFVESEAYRSGRLAKVQRRAAGQRVVGDVELELAPQGIALLFKHMLGSVATTGTNPYTHTCTPGSLTGLSLTVQKGVTDNAGTTRPFDYLGCKITDWTINANVGELAMLRCGLYGIHEDTGQSLAAASYPTGWQPFIFTEGSLTIAGTATPVKSFELSGDNGLQVDRYRIQSTNPTRSLQPIQSAIRDYSGSVVADFQDLTAYNRFVNQTQAALVLTFNAGASAQMTITTNVEFDGETPKASGVGNEVDQPLPFTCIHATSDASLITIAIVNADSTP